MVMHKRRSRLTPKKHLYGYDPSSSQTALPYGASLDSPIRPATSFQRSYSDSLKSLFSSLDNSRPFPSWILKCSVAVFAISWCAAIYWNNQMRVSLTRLQVNYNIATLHYEEAKKTLEDALSSQRVLEAHVQNLERTKHALENEIRMGLELQEGETLALPHASVSDIVERRQAVLQDKVESLRAYIQEESRREVLEKFGPGPHRVKLTVMMRNTNEEKIIVLEMAPLELMPHSVHLFLELVSHKMWDNTVFWHQVGLLHLVLAVQMNFDTGESQHDRLKQMRLHGVSFAEHSDAFPHEQYTVAFGNRGPDFYINARNNTWQHGFGKQPHHALEDEADPCFAEVVEGRDVVDALNLISIEETNKPEREKDMRQDQPFSQIVRAEILGWTPTVRETRKFQQIETGTTEPRSETATLNEPKKTEPREKNKMTGRQTPKGKETAHLAPTMNNLQEMRGVV